MNIVETARNALSADMVRKLGSYTGENAASTERALGGMIPASLATLLSHVESGPAGARGALDLVNAQQRAIDAAGGAEKFYADPNALNGGRSIVEKLFGDRHAAITSFFAKPGGVSATAAPTLLGFAAQWILGLLGRQVRTQSLDAPGFARMLLGQRQSILSALPAGLSSVLGLQPAAAAAEGDACNVHVYESPAVKPPVRPAVVETTKPRSSWLIPVILALLLIPLALYLFRPHAHRPAPTVSVRETPVRVMPRPAPVVPPPARGGGPVGAAPIAPAPPPVIAPAPPPVVAPAPVLPPTTATQRAEPARGGGAVRPGNQFESYLSGANLGPLPRSFRMDGLNFQFGTTDLVAGGDAAVDRLATDLQQHPNARIQLVGHTDSVGGGDANQRLSQERANTIRDMLIQRGVDGSRISVGAQAASAPAAANDTDQGRAANRRTEVVLLER